MTTASTIRQISTIIQTVTVSIFFWGCGSAPGALETTEPATLDEPEKEEPLPTMYAGDLPDHEPTSEEAALFQSLRRQSVLRCKQDSRLGKAARIHAQILLGDLQSIGDGQIDLLRFTLRQHGGYDYAIEPIITTLDPKGREFLEEITHKQRNKWSHCAVGLASNDKATLAVWIGVERAVEMDPFPMAPVPATSMRLSGKRLQGQTGDILLFVSNPKGSVSKMSPQRSTATGKFDFVIPLGPSGKYIIELLHDTGHGPETVVLLPIYVGVEQDVRPVVIPKENGDDTRPPRDVLLHYLNTARKQQGLPPLQQDKRLEKVAKAHTDDMIASGFFGHVSPTNGALASRLNKAGHDPKRSAENIASSTSLLRIHRNLMDSPAHRINMVDRTFTHVGIGVGKRGDKYVVTQVYARW